MSNTTDMVSRRNLLAGIAAVPTLAAVTAAPVTAWAEDIDATATRVKAALKDAKGTKLVLLGAPAQVRSRVFRAA